eukprot:scaffold48971_cov66-Phaeocystis_antarctica.AAC.2
MGVQEAWGPSIIGFTIGESSPSHPLPRAAGPSPVRLCALCSGQAAHLPVDEGPDRVDHEDAGDRARGEGPAGQVQGARPRAPELGAAEALPGQPGQPARGLRPRDRADPALHRAVPLAAQPGQRQRPLRVLPLPALARGPRALLHGGHRVAHRVGRRRAQAGVGGHAGLPDPASGPRRLAVRLLRAAHAQDG